MGLSNPMPSSQQKAASVASLIGRLSAAEAFVAASRNFRAQPVSTLKRDELMDNKPNPALHAKTIAAELGSVDAFMSHSWSDEGSAKFDALHEWASGETAHALHDADVLIWLDKACLDQANIDDALAGLPVFLAGCRQLLVLAGPTYTSRLWCVMELCVFLHMGGARGDVVVKLVGGNTTKLAQGLAHFDAAKAKCFLVRDRQRLLAVIETSFGTFAPFNMMVRGIFSRAVSSDEVPRLGPIAV